MIHNFELKRDVLATLVREAVRERGSDAPNGSPFEGFTSERNTLVLVEALKTSDALDVLNEILNEKESN